MKDKRRIIAVVVLVVLAAGTLGVRLALNTRASAPEEARRAAEEIAARQGGGEQPKNPAGVPLDAVVQPGTQPGSFTSSK